MTLLKYSNSLSLSLFLSLGRVKCTRNGIDPFEKVILTISLRVLLQYVLRGCFILEWPDVIYNVHATGLQFDNKHFIQGSTNFRELCPQLDCSWRMHRGSLHRKGTANRSRVQEVRSGELFLLMNTRNVFLRIKFLCKRGESVKLNVILPLRARWYQVIYCLNQRQPRM